jgi:hypothetical protein
VKKKFKYYNEDGLRGSLVFPEKIIVQLKTTVTLKIASFPATLTGIPAGPSGPLSPFAPLSPGCKMYQVSFKCTICNYF